MHSITDDPPTKVEYTRSVADIGHSENQSGTAGRYAPYNTTRPKIDKFIPGKSATLAERLSALVSKK